MTFPGIAFRVDTATTLEYLTLEGGFFGGSKLKPTDTSTVYMGVDMTIMNLQDSAISVERGPMVLLDANGNECSRIDNPHENNINAKDSARVSHTFVIKRGAVSGAALRVQDPFSHQTGMIYLNRK